jgi:hypothetical protein
VYVFASNLPYASTLILCSYSYTNIDDDDNGDDDEVLWSHSDFVSIIESFHLPKRLVQMIVRNHCCFTEFYLGKKDGETDRYGKPCLKKLLQSP